MKNIKLIIGIIIGMAIMYGISNAYNLNASEVTYDKKNTTLESEQVQGTIDELGILATTKLSEIEGKINDLQNDLYEFNFTKKINLIDKSTYTPTQNGYVFCKIRANAENGYIQIDQDGITKLILQIKENGYNASGSFISSNEPMTIHYERIYTDNENTQIYFVPFK